MRSALLLAMPVVMLLSAVMSWWSFKAFPSNLFVDDEASPVVFSVSFYNERPSYITPTVGRA